MPLRAVLLPPHPCVVGHLHALEPNLARKPLVLRPNLADLGVSMVGQRALEDLYP